MSDMPPAVQDADTSTAPTARSRMTVFAKIGVAFAVLLMLVGLIAPFVLKADPKSASTGGVPSLGAAGFAGETASASAAEDGDANALWPKAVFKVGFSFFIGFVAAFALRMFLKVALLAAGFMVLALFGLQYSGLVEVKWGAMEERYNTASSWIRDEFSSISSFLTGYLPASGAGLAGIYAGLRRKGM